MLAKIDRFIPAFSKEDPVKILTALTEKCRKTPDKTDQQLVQDGIISGKIPDHIMDELPKH
jgi:hypothetical protein